jgi:PhnB protein
MTSSVRPIPEGYHSVTPYLAVDGAARAIEFYKQAFGATEVMRMAAPGGKIGHAEIRIGDSRIMLADEYPDMGFRSPKAYGGSPVGLHLYVEDVDAVARQAVAAGAREVRPVKDQFYGDRTGSFEDPFGHVWHIATRKEELSPDELKRRAVAAMGQQGS